MSAENWSSFVLTTQRLEVLLTQQRQELEGLQEKSQTLTGALSSSQRLVETLQAQLQTLTVRLKESETEASGLQTQLANLKALYSSTGQLLQTQERQMLASEQRGRFYQAGFYIATGAAVAAAGTAVLITVLK
jgi:chromosome segregation ATPase